VTDREESHPIEGVTGAVDTPIRSGDGTVTGPSEKLPTGALTALLVLLLMRGGFVPGLTALDTSARILAWALVFGYAQQQFTRLVDQQAHTLIQSVRGLARASRSASAGR
jgi:hypothetical protein